MNEKKAFIQSRFYRMYCLYYKNVVIGINTDLGFEKLKTQLYKFLKSFKYNIKYHFYKDSEC